MRIGIDFDNTLGDFVALLQRITREQTGFEMRGLREQHPELDSLEPIIHAAVGKERFESFMHEIQLSTVDYVVLIVYFAFVLGIAETCVLMPTRTRNWATASQILASLAKRSFGASAPAHSS